MTVRYWCHFSSQTNLDSFNSDVLKLEPGINCRSPCQATLSLWIIILLIQVVQDLLLDAFWQFCFTLFLCQDFIVEQMRTGFTYDTLTYCSPERASVNSASGERELLTASRTAMLGKVSGFSVRGENTRNGTLLFQHPGKSLLVLSPTSFGHSVLSLCEVTWALSGPRTTPSFVSSYRRSTPPTFLQTFSARSIRPSFKACSKHTPHSLLKLYILITIKQTTFHITVNITQFILYL